MSVGPRVLIIHSRYYADIADELYAGATTALQASGATYETVEVPGALEMPAALSMAVAADAFDAYVVLGCVIRGETSHYDVVVNESNRGLMDLVVRHALAFGNGLLTVENRAQAHERSRPDRLNKGGGAAEAALAMVRIRQDLMERA